MILLLFQCVQLIRDFAGSSILKVARLCMIFVRHYIFNFLVWSAILKVKPLLKKLTSIIKRKIQTVTLFFVYGKSWDAFRHESSGKVWWNILQILLILIHFIKNISHWFLSPQKWLELIQNGHFDPSFVFFSNILLLLLKWYPSWIFLCRQ